MSHAFTLPHGATVGELITTGAQCLEQAGVGFGHGTANAGIDFVEDQRRRRPLLREHHLQGEQEAGKFAA